MEGGSILRLKKRKLTLDEIGRCHPRETLKRYRKTGDRKTQGGKKRSAKGTRCLPSSFYKQISHNYHRKSSVFSEVGCPEGAEHCLLDKMSMSDEKKKELRKTYLRPRQPKEWLKNPNTWLDNYNIEHVMDQYQETYSWFRFLGVFPIDFSAPNPYLKSDKVECLNKELCELNLHKEYKKGIRGIGMVFNLDPHYKGGSHWVALYINLSSIKQPIVGYFDSYGYETPPMIGRFMRSLKLQVKNCFLGYNARRFQYGNSECGMFSIYFLICMIHGIPFDEFCKDTLHDRSMLELRSVLFGQ